MTSTQRNQIISVIICSGRNICYYGREDNAGIKKIKKHIKRITVGLAQFMNFGINTQQYILKDCGK